MSMGEGTTIWEITCPKYFLGSELFKKIFPLERRMGFRVSGRRTTN